MTLAASVHYVCAAITDQSSATRFRSATLEFTTQHALSGLGWRTHIQPMLLDELQVNHNEAHPALMRMRGQGVFYLSASLPGYVNHAWRGLIHRIPVLDDMNSGTNCSSTDACQNGQVISVSVPFGQACYPASAC